MTWWRKIPVDAAAFAAIAVVVIASHVPLLHYGMCVNDPAWYFHFGRKVLHGAVPYRDFVWQVGPVPLYVDAAAQAVFGQKYIASLYAALAIVILRVFVVWLIARRIAGWRAAIGLCVFCAFDPLFAFAHHWSTPYAELSFAASGLGFVLAVKSEGRRALVHYALAGFFAGTVLWSRQSSAVTIAMILAVTTIALYARRDTLTRPRFAALWGGFAAAVVVLAIALAAAGALGPAIQQMFLDAPQKKGIHGLDAVLDGISGGALADGRYSRLGGFLFFLGIPTAIVIASIYLAARARDVPAAAIGMLLLPCAIILSLATRYASLEYATDLPRTLLTALAILVVVAPSRLRAWLGIEPIVAIGLGALPLASDAALELSFPGRGWGDIWALVTGGILISLASTRLAQRVKTYACAALAAGALIHTAVSLYHDFDPFAKPEAADGTLAENSFTPEMRGAKLMGDVHVPEWRARALEWLAQQVPPHRTCFVYANAPALYDLLGCTNPTKLDDTIADYPSAQDAADAVAALRAHPPDFILAHDRMWMSPPISLDLGEDITRYDSWNPRASFALHVGLRSIIDQYESLGTVGEAIGPVFAKQASNHWDTLDAIHVYRRKGP